MITKTVSRCYRRKQGRFKKPPPPGSFHIYLTNWLLRNQEVHYRPYISSPLVHILSKIYPFSRMTTPALKSILILFSHLRLGLPNGFPTKTLYAFLDCSIRATCPAHLSRLYLRLLIMLGEEYNACSSALSPLCNLICSQYSATSSKWTVIFFAGYFQNNKLLT